MDEQSVLWNLTNHTPTREGIEEIELIRRFAKEFARAIVLRCPDGREKSLAITNLEQATMWAVASVARTMTTDVKSDDNERK